MLRAVCANGSEPLPIIVESVPQIKSPAAFVSMESHDVSVFTLRPPVKT